MRELEYDLNRDIQLALEQLGEVSLSELLTRRFRPHRGVPRAYARRFAVKRRVESCLVGPDTRIPERPGQGWDLLILQGYAFSLQELEKLCRRLEAVEGHPAVLVGLPRAPLAIGEEIKEALALESMKAHGPYLEGAGARALAEHAAFLERRIREQFRVAMRPRAFRWRYQGAPLEWTPPDCRQAFLVQLLEMIYPDTPVCRPAASRRALAQGLEELLDIGRPVFASRSLPCPSTGVLQRSLGQAGILEVVADFGSYSRLRVVEWPSAEEDVGDLRLWRDLLEQVYGDRENERRQSLASLLKWLADPPRGIRDRLAQLYLAAALRARPDDLELRGPSGSVSLSGATLREALASPARWELRYRVAGRPEEAFLKAMRGMFGTGNLAIMM
ncbi:MAG: hypothetical protein AB1758_18045, partial [Candidatus Eremiobacterota bacterium]